ncbi:fimbrial protein [Enterobacter cloacae]|uniref:fimbrial protein n=1 Tax=Enterobacter cloacae TaxID=550 RepID=UPI00101AF17B|nr:fimbrial protein [Enterobacter cloacae]QBC03390.1 type 1 fimbrial protein [Enterobacter cloacae]
MKLNKALLAVAITLGMTAAANAADTGVFSFNGTVVDTPCSITPGSLDQDFDFGTLAQAALIDGGRSAPVMNTLTLANCVAGTSSTAHFTFTGPVGHTATVFDTGVKNVGIELKMDGNVVRPNTAADHTLRNGPNTLNFEAVAVGSADNAVDPVGLGNLNAIANLSITYS